MDPHPRPERRRPPVAVVVAAAVEGIDALAEELPTAWDAVAGTAAAP